jgi:hypothetical protein
MWWSGEVPALDLGAAAVGMVEDDPFGEVARSDVTR